MIPQRPIHRLALLTLEAATAHGIHAGQGDATHDVLLVRDANGLPALPGSSLAGVLRRRLAHTAGDAASQLLFGHEEGASLLQVGWGLAHDSRNQAREGLVPLAEQERDAILPLLAAPFPLLRDRVRLNARGTAHDTGKYDVTGVFAGTRYTLPLRLWCDGGASADAWTALLAVLARPVRLGHGTRSGFGLFHPVRLASASWDLRDPEARRAFLGRSRSRNDWQGLAEHALTDDAVDTVRLPLQAEGAWRIGNITRTRDTGEVQTFLREPRLHWQNGSGRLGPLAPVIPGSGVKGALRHRTAFHLACLEGRFAGTGMPADDTGLDTLFGNADPEQASAGLVLFSDACLEGCRTVTRMHNAIDRFTGGTRDGLLFSEEVIWGQGFTLRLEVADRHALDALAQTRPTVLAAFTRALEDLAAGWLPLGARGSQGQGVFLAENDQWKATLPWSLSTPCAGVTS